MPSCSAMETCCAPGANAAEMWTVPDGAPNAFAHCYIQGPNVSDADCPAGWTFNQHGPGTGQCIFTPFNPNYFREVKPCDEVPSHCGTSPSVQSQCGNPMLRSGLSLMVNCIIEGGPDMTCATGWHQERSNKCIKSISGGSDGPAPIDFGLAYLSLIHI